MYSKPEAAAGKDNIPKEILQSDKEIFSSSAEKASEILNTLGLISR